MLLSRDECIDPKKYQINSVICTVKDWTSTTHMVKGRTRNTRFRLVIAGYDPKYHVRKIVKIISLLDHGRLQSLSCQRWRLTGSISRSWCWRILWLLIRFIFILNQRAAVWKLTSLTFFDPKVSKSNNKYDILDLKIDDPDELKEA